MILYGQGYSIIHYNIMIQVTTRMKFCRTIYYINSHMSNVQVYSYHYTEVDYTEVQLKLNALLNSMTINYSILFN